VYILHFIATLQNAYSFEQVMQWYSWRRCNKHRNI